MKNVTVSVPDEVYRQARIRAAENGTSVSALVAGYTIIEAARTLGCTEVLSEDLRTDQDYDGVRVVNPFAQLPG